MPAAQPERIVVVSVTRWFWTVFFALAAGFFVFLGVMTHREGGQMWFVSLPLTALALWQTFFMVTQRTVITGDVARSRFRTFRIVDARVGIGPTERGFHTPWRVLVLREDGRIIRLGGTFANYSGRRPAAKAVRFAQQIRDSIAAARVRRGVGPLDERTRERMWRADQQERFNDLIDVDLGHTRAAPRPTEPRSATELRPHRHRGPFA